MFGNIKKKIAQFREEVQAIVQQELNQNRIDELDLEKAKTQSLNDFLGIDRVCQLNIQFFEIAGK
ncbi:MAG: hypothetical protein ACD_66C00268G0001 [uncultured bacterium]|nr:MAG: hypothetical protein ACD_66C00268G0001 [uncultured bacterium]